MDGEVGVISMEKVDTGIIAGDVDAPLESVVRCPTIAGKWVRV